jgi:hypothetical protein
MKKHTGADDPNVVQNSVDSTRRRFLRTSAAASVAALAALGLLFSQPRSLPDGPSASAS